MLVAADLDAMREMLLYAYGLSHERMGVLSLNQPRSAVRWHRMRRILPNHSAA